MMKIRLLVCLVLVLAASSFAQVNTEKYRLYKDSLGVYGRIGVGGTIQGGNTDEQEVWVDGILQAQWEGSYAFIILDGKLEWNDGKQFSNDGLAQLRYIDDLGKNWEFESFIQYNFDRNRKLTHRGLGGAGVRYTLLYSPQQQLFVATSFFAEYENYDLLPGDIHANNEWHVRSSTYITYNLALSGFAKLGSVFYFQPDVTETNDFRILSEVSLDMKLTSFLSLESSLHLLYDHRPPMGVKSTDTELEVTLYFVF